MPRTRLPPSVSDLRKNKHIAAKPLVRCFALTMAISFALTYFPEAVYDSCSKAQQLLDSVVSEC